MPSIVLNQIGSRRYGSSTVYDYTPEVDGQPHGVDPHGNIKIVSIQITDDYPDPEGAMARWINEMTLIIQQELDAQ